MSSLQAAAAKVPAAKVMDLRVPVLIAAVLGAVGLLVTGLLGHIMMGFLGIVGMGLGVANARWLQHSVVKVTTSENPSKKALFGSSMQRLALITIVAVGLGIFVRPNGIGVFLGLAVFQIILVANTAMPVLKERHQQ